MLSPDHNLQTEQNALQQAVQAVLAPLAQLCVARGITIQAVEEQIRQTFVQAARRAQEEAGSPPNTSRISAATGLTRREVARLLEQNLTEYTPRPSPSAQVFTRWLTDPTLRDSQQQPLVLPRQGTSPSFEALAQSVTRDVHPRTLLDELSRLNLVLFDAASDTVSLQKESFVPRGDWSRMVGFLGHNVGDHLRAATANVLGSGQQHFEQAIHADELSEHSMAALRQMVTRQWKHLQGTMVPQIEALMQDDRAEQREANQRIRIGLFTWSEPMAAPASSAAQGAADENL